MGDAVSVEIQAGPVNFRWGERVGEKRILGTEELFHQTSSANAGQILSQGFRPGSQRGLGGIGGMYFAGSAAETNGKARGGSGTILQATVNLGTCLVISAGGDPNLTAQRVASQGCQSVLICRPRMEYVVYNPSQVSNIRRVQG